MSTTLAKKETLQRKWYVIDAAGKHYTTNSKFFREELANIFNIFAPEPFSIIVRKQVSKAGRTFVTCELE